MTINSLEEFRFMDMPAGYMELWKFCQTVDAGEVPDAQTLKLLADAFRKFLRISDLESGLWVLAQCLRLSDKPTGRRKTERVAGLNYGRAVGVHVEVLARGIKRSDAIKMIAKETSCDVRTVRRALAEFPDAESFARQITVIPRMISAMEARRAKKRT